MKKHTVNNQEHASDEGLNGPSGECGTDPEKTEEGISCQELNDKYLRLYAEFDNYRKRVTREKDDLVKYGNESLLYELLPAIDHLELALKHTSGEPNSGLVQGVEITLRELQRTLEKFGLVKIEASGRVFDPSVHHAMSQVEREEMEEKMVVEEFRPGYLYKDKVLRPSLVSVSVKPKQSDNSTSAADNPEGSSSPEAPENISR